jgi:hypothetical protein
MCPYGRMQDKREVLAASDMRKITAAVYSLTKMGYSLNKN